MTLPARILVAALLAVLTLALAPGLARASQGSFGKHVKTSSRVAHPAATSAAKSHQGWVKYYIVQPPHDGVPEYLYEIAEHTLGSGKLATEIFDLNKGRLEPGGQHLVSPSIIRPGWILVLPSRATGTGVRYGPLPVVPLSSPSVAPSAPASTSASPPARHPVRPAARHSAGGALSTDLLLKAALGGALIMLVLTIGLMLYAWRLRRAGRPNAAPRPTAVPQPKAARRRPRSRPVPARAAQTGAAETRLAKIGLAKTGSAKVRAAKVSGAKVFGAKAPAAKGRLARPGSAKSRAGQVRDQGGAVLVGPTPDASSRPTWLAGSGLDPDPQAAVTLPAPPMVQAAADEYGGFSAAVPPSAAPPALVAVGEPPEQTSAPVVPSWLGAASPLAGPAAAWPAPAEVVAGRIGRFAPASGTVREDGQPAGEPAGASEPTAGEPTAGELPDGAVTAGRDEPSWPRYLAGPGGDTGLTPSALTRPYDDVPASSASGEDSQPPDEPADEPLFADAARPPKAGFRPGADQEDPGELGEPVFSPAALRVLGARPPREPGDDDMPPQRHEVALGDDLVEVVLTQAPAPSQSSRSRGGKTWLASTPYLLWAPLPYDVPDDGLAFACIGAGDEGCLFLDIGAAPGAVAIGGDPAAAVRVAESIVHQLGIRARDDQAIAVILVGDAVGEPHPPSATWVPTLRDLAGASLDSPPDRTDIVCCALRSSEDAFVLARHVGSARRRIVPLVLGHLPGAPWAFTAQPSFRPDHGLPSLAGSRMVGSA